MMCKICRKSKEEPKDKRIPWCEWDGTGEHPRFVWKRMARKGRTCDNCGGDVWIGERFCADLKAKEQLCLDCAMLIYRGIEYLTEKLKLKGIA